MLDAGATDTGRPYFVMELVRGVKITEYCDQVKPSTSGRLDAELLGATPARVTTRLNGRDRRYLRYVSAFETELLDFETANFSATASIAANGGNQFLAGKLPSC